LLLIGYLKDERRQASIVSSYFLCIEEMVVCQLESANQSLPTRLFDYKGKYRGSTYRGQYMINLERSSVISERNYKVNHLSVSTESKVYWENLLGENTMNQLYKIPGIVNHLNNCDFLVSGDIFNRISQLASIFESNLFSADILDFYEEQEDFACFYQYFLKLAQYYFKRELSANIRYENRAVIRDFLKAIYKKIKNISIRTLINEIHFLKSEGYLKGRNSEEEYEYYQENYLKDINYIYEICENYPVMLRGILETIVSFTDFLIGVLHNLQQDKDEIIKHIFYGEPFDQIISFDADIADSHQNSKTVIKFTFDNGKSVIYKPHSLTNEIVYQTFVNWISQNCSIPNFSRKIIEKGNYGWEEVIIHKSCFNELEIKNYYTRMGINLFAAYLLKTSDLHYENLIAYGEFPIIIDLETLTGIGAEAEDTAEGQVKKTLSESVLYLGLLPVFHWEVEGKGVNVSGISGSAGQKLPFKIPYIKNNRTSDISIEYRYPKTHGGKNLPSLKGINLKEKLFTQDLLTGFNLAYTCSIEKKEDLKAVIKAIKNTKSRYLLRDTQHYSSLLTASYHPDFMMDGSDRNILFYQLNENCNYEIQYRNKIVEAEVRELMKGDIPQFFIEADGKALFFSDGTRLEGYFHTSAYSSLCERIDNLSYSDMETQDMCIRITMELYPQKWNVRPGISSFQTHPKKRRDTVNEMIVDRNLVSQAAEKIGDRLVAGAIFNDNFTDVNWIGIFRNGTKENHKIFKPLNPYLYDGIAGIAIFMNILNTINSKPSYTRLCEIIDRTLFAYTDLNLDITDTKDSTEKRIGAFTGEASLVYTYQILYIMTDNIEYLNYAKRHVQILTPLIEKDKDYDLLNGKAGVIIVLCNLYELTKEEEYLITAKKAADILIRKAVNMPIGVGIQLSSCEVPLGGLSHGNSGFSLALALLSEAAKTKEYDGFIEELLNYEESLYHSEWNNWTDLREGKNMKSSVSWCHGSGGILLSRRILLNILGNGFTERLNRDIDRAVKNITDNPVRDSYCLCHGNCGNLHILNSYARYIGDNNITGAYNSFISSLATGILNDSSDITLSEYSHPGFMTGVTGIGYSLLGYLSDNVPDILTLSLRHITEQC
jgi:type 2 lantibiotic biosynthesis protein LanM